MQRTLSDRLPRKNTKNTRLIELANNYGVVSSSELQPCEASGEGLQNVSGGEASVVGKHGASSLRRQHREPTTE